METKFGCLLWIITENESPDIVTEITGVTPTRVEKTGTPIRHKKTGELIPDAFEKQNVWTYDSTAIRNEESWDLIYSCNEIMGMIESNKDAFMEVFNRYKDKCLLFYCYESNYNISFRIQPEIWQRIAPYNLMVDFDLYALGEDEDEK